MFDLNVKWSKISLEQVEQWISDPPADDVIPAGGVEDGRLLVLLPGQTDPVTVNPPPGSDSGSTVAFFSEDLGVLVTVNVGLTEAPAGYMADLTKAKLAGEGSGWTTPLLVGFGVAGLIGALVWTSKKRRR